MYQYNEIDQKLVDERVAQFRDQTARYLAGQLSPEAFLPLRLQNGLYVQRHAPMLRVAIPYGMLNSLQLRALANIADQYDRGYAHITTRQNIQFNWPELSQVPDILHELAQVQMHAIQTSGNCIRNTTTDQFAGVIADEIIDPRPYCELIRQWSTFHPEFAFLPRKFKIAVNACASADRAAIEFHDIGLQILKKGQSVGFKVFVGGGLGRTPIQGSVIQEFLPEKDLLSYLEAIVRVYNQHGRRDNKYKARIKILVKALGIDAFRAKVDAEWQQMDHESLEVPSKEIARLSAFFTEPNYEQAYRPEPDTTLLTSSEYSRWLDRNVFEHKRSDFAIVTLSLKKSNVAPGDISSAQLRAIADLAEQYSFGEVRTTHEQNIVLADVAVSALPELWQKLEVLGLATPTVGTLTDTICCPGGDYCALANAKSIPIAQQILDEFTDLDYLYDLGDIDLNISGCMNACGHHHIGNIGILGVDKKGEEFYQISLGGHAGINGSIGKILGPSFKAEEIASVIRTIIDIYVEQRQEGESFLSFVHRVGVAHFKEKVYA